MRTRTQFNRRRDLGATMLEYAVMGAVVAGLLYVGFESFGTSMSNFFTDLGAWAESQAPDSNGGSASDGTSTST